MRQVYLEYGDELDAAADRIASAIVEAHTLIGDECPARAVVFRRRNVGEGLWTFDQVNLDLTRIGEMYLATDEARVADGRPRKHPEPDASS